MAAATVWSFLGTGEPDFPKVEVPQLDEAHIPPDRNASPPRCLAGIAEQQCVTWHRNLPIVDVQYDTALIIALQEDGLVQGISAETGKTMWSTSTAFVGGNIHPLFADNRAILLGEGDVGLLDSYTGHLLGVWKGALGVVSEGGFTVGPEGREESRETLVVDSDDGRAVNVDTRLHEHIFHVGSVILSLLATEDASATTSLRAYSRSGDLLWSISGDIWSSGVTELAYIMVDNHIDKSTALQGIDLKTGRPVWSRDLAADHLSTMSMVGNSLIFSEDGYIKSLDASTGADGWASQIGDRNILLEAREFNDKIVGRMWSGNEGGAYILIDGDSGEIIWKLEHNDTRENSAEIAVHSHGAILRFGGKLLIVSPDGTFECLAFPGVSGSAVVQIIRLDPMVLRVGSDLYGVDSSVRRIADRDCQG